MLTIRPASFCAAVFFGLSGCTATFAPPAPGLERASVASDRLQTPIRHVIVLVQENRTFDNLFAGYPGADSAISGKTHDGRTVRLREITFAKVPLSHFYADARTGYAHGRMNGFDLIPFRPPFTKLSPYSYVNRSLIKPYWDLAQQYVLADRMFPTEFGPSFTAHLDLIAGTTSVSPTESVVDMAMLGSIVEPGRCDDPPGTVTSLLTSDGRYLANQGPAPCFSFHTLAGALDRSRVPWKFYAAYWPGGTSLWNPFAAIRSVRYGPDWHNVVKTPMQILKDAPAGKLPAVSWVIPTMPDSDHPSAGKPYGPSWVASVVNAIGTGPDWKSSAIIILWDDWGGWYDNAAPPQPDYRGLGLRVPCLIVSPYAKKGYVAHEQYEFGSILRTIEEFFGLGTIGTTDRRSKAMMDAFDFSQPPRRFQKIQAHYPAGFFLHERQSNLNLDD